MNKYAFIRCLYFPVLFVFLLWIVKFLESTFGINLIGFGLYPRSFTGIVGIVTGPMLHSDYAHLFSNTLPLLFLGGITFYFYREIAFQVFMWVYLMTGIWVWAAARESFHIGASGLVYGFVCFLFFSGIFRKDNRLLSLSMLVTFIYGSLVWGVLPIQERISWESHLLGSLSGIITAFYYRNEGPQPMRYSWEEEEEEAAEMPEHGRDNNATKEVPIKYLYRPKEKDPGITDHSKPAG